MSVNLKTNLSIETCDGKKVWHVPEDCIERCDGTKYIKLPRRHHGFMILVMHGCTSLPEKRTKHFSLSASLGYQKLLDLRAKAQQEHEASREQRQEVHSLFKTSVAQKVKKKRYQDLKPNSQRTVQRSYNYLWICLMAANWL